MAKTLPVEDQSLPVQVQGDQRERAKELREVEGKSFAEIAEVLGLHEPTIRKWAIRDKWSTPKVVRHLVTERMVVKRNTPALQAALDQLFKGDKVDKERAFDEHLHDIACAVPFIIKQLPVDEWITKADKIAKLVTMAREVLGKTGGTAQQKPMVSIGILSSTGNSPKVQRAEVLELEQLAQDESTGS